MVMSAIRDILGHIEIQTALAARKCSHRPKKHVIMKGQVHLAVIENQSRKNYCVLCAADILARAENKLLSIKQGLAPVLSRLGEVPSLRGGRPLSQSTHATACEPPSS